jgi:hypothetical protein
MIALNPHKVCFRSKELDLQIVIQSNHHLKGWSKNISRILAILDSKRFLINH